MNDSGFLGSWIVDLLTPAEREARERAIAARIRRQVHRELAPIVLGVPLVYVAAILLAVWIMR